MEPNVAFIRYNLPWEYPHAVDAADGEGWSGHPPPRLRKLRMNIGTRTWSLRKAPVDLTVADALIIDLDQSEEALFKGMQPKIRYNIRPARGRGFGYVSPLPTCCPRSTSFAFRQPNATAFPRVLYGIFPSFFPPLRSIPNIRRSFFFWPQKAGMFWRES